MEASFTNSEFIRKIWGQELFQIFQINSIDSVHKLSIAGRMHTFELYLHYRDGFIELPRNYLGN